MTVCYHTVSLYIHCTTSVVQCLFRRSDLSHFAFLAIANTPFRWNVVFPTRKPRCRGQNAIFPGGQRVCARPPTDIWAPPGTPFSYIFVSKPCRGAGARTGAQRGAQSRPKDGQSDPNGPQRVAFGRPGGHFWRESRDSGPLQEPQYLLCFNHIMRVRAGPFSLLNAPWGRSTPAEPSFLDFLRPLGRKGGAQGGPGCPKDVQTATRGHPKITKKSPSGPQGEPGCPGRSRGYPPR